VTLKQRGTWRRIVNVSRMPALIPAKIPALFMMTYPSRGYEFVLILDLALRARRECGMRLSRFRGDRGVLPERLSVLRRRSKRSVSTR